MDYSKSGIYPYTNGDAAFPGTAWTGPLIAGNVLQSNGSGTLATVGTSVGVANTGVATMSQSQAGILQSGTPVTTDIVIPAQSQILRITVMVTTATTGVATTFGVGSTASATAFTTAGAVDGATLGPVSASPGANATQIGNWDNVGDTDVRILLTFTNTGSGVVTLTVEYAQGINLAS